MFVRQPQYGLRFTFLILLAASLFIADYKYDVFAKAKESTATVTGIALRVVDYPVVVFKKVSNFFTFHSHLLEENEKFKTLLLQHRAKLQELSFLEIENENLRELMHAGKSTKADYLLANILSVTSDPFMHRFVIDKGRDAAVAPGTAVIDGNGLIGIITEVRDNHSYVLQISDSSAAIPVENARNGLRTIVVGTGDTNRLHLQYITGTTDIQTGDMLVTSGIGGKLPAGYPVAVVYNIDVDNSKPFADVTLLPMAKLEQSRLVLLVQLKPNQANETS